VKHKSDPRDIVRNSYSEVFDVRSVHRPCLSAGSVGSRVTELGWTCVNV